MKSLKNTKSLRVFNPLTRESRRAHLEARSNNVGKLIPKQHSQINNIENVLSSNEPTIVLEGELQPEVGVTQGDILTHRESVGSALSCPTSAPSTLTCSTPATPIFDINVIMIRLDKVKSVADSDHITFEIAGRNALKSRLNDVYQLYYEVQESGNLARVISSMKYYLKNQDVVVRANSPDASIFTRYIFRGASDKQVHVYGLSLLSAYTDGVLPKDFFTFVNRAGGLEGIRVRSVEPVEKSKGPALWEMGVCWVEGFDTILTIPVKEGWQKDERCKVFIALPNGETDADLKPTVMSIETCKAILTLYNNERVRLIKEKEKADIANDKEVARKVRHPDKPLKTRILDEFEKEALRDYNLMLPDAELKVANLEADLRAAVKNSKHFAIEECRRDLVYANLELQGVRNSIKFLTGE